MGEGRRLWGFGDRSSGCEWSWRRVFALGESGDRVRDWRVNVGWRFRGAEGGEICRDEAWVVGGSGSVALSPAPTSREGSAVRWLSASLLTSATPTISRKKWTTSSGRDSAVR